MQCKHETAVTAVLLSEPVSLEDQTLAEGCTVGREEGRTRSTGKSQEGCLFPNAQETSKGQGKESNDEGCILRK